MLSTAAAKNAWQAWRQQHGIFLLPALLPLTLSPHASSRLSHCHLIVISAHSSPACCHWGPLSSRLCCNTYHHSRMTYTLAIGEKRDDNRRRRINVVSTIATARSLLTLCRITCYLTHHHILATLSCCDGHNVMPPRRAYSALSMPTPSSSYGISYAAPGAVP